jgi:hypothetical protein
VEKVEFYNGSALLGTVTLPLEPDVGDTTPPTVSLTSPTVGTSVMHSDEKEKKGG